MICVCRESPFASVDGRNLPPRPLGGWEEGHPHTRGASRHREPTRPRPFPRPMPTPRADTARGEAGQVPKRPTVAPPLAPATRADTASRPDQRTDRAQRPSRHRDRPDQRTDRDPDPTDTATVPTNNPDTTPTNGGATRGGEDVRTYNPISYRVKNSTSPQ